MSKKSQWASLTKAIAATVICVSPAAFAVDNVWTGATSTDWNDPTNWSLGRVPTNANGATTGDAFDDAVVNSTTVVPLISANLAATPRDIVVGSGTGNVGLINQTAGTAASGNGNWVFVGRDGGTGTYNQSGGTLAAGDRLNVGRNGGNGIYNLGNAAATGGAFTGIGLGTGSITTGGRIYVAGEGGDAGIGILNINTTGAVTAGNDLNIGAANGTGTVNLDAGTVSVGGWLSVGRDENGNSGTGNFNQSGGAITVAGNTVLGLPGTHGNFNISGGAHTTNGEFWVGNSGNNGTASVGVANVSGGTVTINNWLAVGREGAVGTLNVSGNGVVQKQGSGHITIGTGAGGNGTVNVSDNATLSSNADIIVAENNPTAVALVNQSGGKVLVGGNLDVQRNGTGTYRLSGGTLSVDGRIPSADETAGGQVLGIDARDGTFAFTGGRITRSGPGVITYVGDLHVGDKSATLKLDNNKTFSISGALDIASGVTLDVTGTTLPGSGAGSVVLGTDGSILGTFDPTTTTLVGLVTPPGATFISESAGEAGSFNANTDKVYWVQENGGNVSLQYSIAPVPEPTFLGFVGISAAMLIGRRRRRG